MIRWRVQLPELFAGLGIFFVSASSWAATRVSEPALREPPAVEWAVPSAAYAYVVLPNKVQMLQGWVEYNPSTCELVSSGAWSLDSEPENGVVTYTTESFELGNGDCPGTTFPFAVINYTWTSTEESEKYDSFPATWTSESFIQNEFFALALGGATATAVDLSIPTDTVSAFISGPADASGTLELAFNGTDGATSSTTTTQPYAPGSYSIGLDRTALTKDDYESLTVKWNASTPPVATTYRQAGVWRVLGTVRYSQYNTPTESSCTSGGPVTVWVVDSLENCNFSEGTLNSTFVSQTQLNGTGESISYGYVKPAAATALRRYCAGQFPPGANNDNTFLQVDSVTGTCNTAVTADSSVAVYPSPYRNAQAPLRCADKLQLVDSSNANFATRTVDDYCPACAGDFGGTDGHIDSYTDNQACTAHDVNDLGNFWTVRTN